MYNYTDQIGNQITYTDQIQKTENQLEKIEQTEHTKLTEKSEGTEYDYV